jgi:hypothetical protein
VGAQVGGHRGAARRLLEDLQLAKGRALARGGHQVAHALLPLFVGAQDVVEARQRGGVQARPLAARRQGAQLLDGRQRRGGAVLGEGQHGAGAALPLLRRLHMPARAQKKQAEG